MEELRLRKELDEKLQSEFPWLKQPELHKDKPFEWIEGYNNYENYGFDAVGDGWYQLIHNLCTEIENIYKEEINLFYVAITRAKKRLISHTTLVSTNRVLKKIKKEEKLVYEELFI